MGPYTTTDGRTITPDGRDVSGLITSSKPSYSDFYMSLWNFDVMSRQNGKRQAQDQFAAFLYAMRDAEVTESMRDAYRVMVNSMYGLPKLRIPSHLRVKDVIFNDPATIVFWEDGTKTVVKAVNEDFDPEKGLAMAFTKKALGNQGNYFNQLKKWIPTKEEENDA